MWQKLTLKTELDARRELEIGSMQTRLLELRRAVRRLEVRIGIDTQPDAEGDEHGKEPSREEELAWHNQAPDPVLERYRAECLRRHDEMDELWRKRRALDEINPIGGLSEQRWREFDAQRAEMRRRLATAGLPSDDEAAPA